MDIAKRCGWLDTAKGIAIILVILGHSAQYYLYPNNFRESLMWMIIYSFHMPFFFILSGYASGLSRNPSFSLLNLKKKIKRLTIPYFSWGLIALPVWFVYRGWSYELITNLIYSPSAASLWYLWALFFIWIMHSLVIKYGTDSYKYLLYMSVYVVLLLMSNSFGGHLGLGEISKYFLYYTIGYEICIKDLINKEITPPHYIGLSISIIGFILLSCITRYEGIPSFWYNYLTNWTIEVLTALTGSLVFIIIAVLIDNKFNVISKLFAKIGRKTLGIYALDTYFIIGLSILFHSKIILYPLAVLTDLAGSYLITSLIQKNKYTSSILLGEYHE